MVVLLAACADPDDLVARIADEAGSPYAAVLVASTKEQVRSDSTGVFDIEVPVGERVVFEVGGTTYRRERRPEDQGTVDLVLPKRRRTLVHCPPETCTVKLDWKLSPSFEAVFRGECTRGAELPIDAPVGLPEVRCIAGDEAVDVAVLDQADGLWVVTPGRPARVRVRPTDDGQLPDACTVLLGQVPARPDGPGAWTGTAHGETVVSATCDGRPALPVTIAADAPADDVLVRWSRTGPRLDLTGPAAWATDVALRPETGGAALHLHAEGPVFELPPLPAGRWRVEVAGDAPRPGEVVSLPPYVPGRLVLVRAGERWALGALELDTPLATGTVPAL